MSELMHLPAMQPYVVCAVVLLANMFALAFLAPIGRAKAKVIVNPEDVKVNPGAQVASVDADFVQRAKRAHANALENVPIFLVVAFLFVLTGASASAAWTYFGVFAGARLLHGIFYMSGLQPFRTLTWIVGVLATFGLMYQVLVAVI